MKKLAVTVVLVAVFLGGYHMGRVPGSPDIAGWAARNYWRAAEHGRRLVGALGGKVEAYSEAVASE